MPDRRPFDAFFEHCLPRVYGTALRRLDDPHVAEAVTESVFLRLFAEMDAAEAIDGFRSRTFQARLLALTYSAIAEVEERGQRIARATRARPRAADLPAQPGRRRGSAV